MLVRHHMTGYPTLGALGHDEQEECGEVAPAGKTLVFASLRARLWLTDPANAESGRDNAIQIFAHYAREAGEGEGLDDLVRRAAAEPPFFGESAAVEIARDAKRRRNTGL